MGQRRDYLDGRQIKAIAVRQANSVLKARERLRRDKKMLEIVKQGKMPYTPGVMSWLSAKLGKKASSITQKDIKKLFS